MFDTLTADEFGRMDELVAALAAAPMSALSRDELLVLTRGFERVKRSLPVVDHWPVGELDRRGVCHEVGKPSTRVLLQKMLRLDPGEAKARVEAAAAGRLLRSGSLPDSGGVPTTLVVTLTWQQLLDRLGLARTSQGA